MKKILVFLLLASSVAFSQNIKVDNNKDFEKALNYYKSKKYDEAINLFKLIEGRNENNSKASASSFFLSKILLEQKKFSELEKQVQKFILVYPYSKYTDEIKKHLIITYIEKSEFYKAFNTVLDIIGSTSSSVTKKEMKLFATKLSQNHLNSTDIKKSLELHKNHSVTPFILLLNAKALLYEGDKTGALKVLNEISSKYSVSDEYIEAQNIMNSSLISNENDEQILIGVMLSLTDKNEREIEASNEILEGIKFAFHEFNEGKVDKIGMMMRDTERKIDKIIMVANEFVQNSKIRCIIGPIFSEEVRTAISEINKSNICLISPTATDDDLTAISDNFYQANPSLTARGKIFAQYLYFVENKRKLAILNSIEGYSPLLAASFTNEFEELGGKILAKETFRSKSFALAEQMSRISSIKNLIDGLYVPISDPNDATAVLSQMVQSGISIDLYGSQDWFLGKGLESSTELSEKLTFDSDYFIDFKDENLKEFSKRFKKLTGKDINRNILYGYDTAKYLLTIMRNIDPTRKNIQYKIESGINVTGYHNNISFDENRINKYINIVRVKDGVFELVDKFRSSK